MSVRMRHTRAHTKNRRSHHALAGLSLASCQKCDAKRLRHRACPACGTYRGRSTVDVLARISKKTEKKTKKVASANGGE
jgi:large subunit ribosomal protein L32